MSYERNGESWFEGIGMTDEGKMGGRICECTLQKMGQGTASPVQPYFPPSSGAYIY